MFREIVVAPVGRGGNVFRPERVTFQPHWGRRGFTAWLEADRARLALMTPEEREAEEDRVAEEALHG